MENQKPLRILSLDGGGVRGISSLYILKEIMAQIKRQQRVANPTEPVSAPRPSDFFDLICGTSTGGLIALMLGRLEMVRPIFLSLSSGLHADEREDGGRNNREVFRTI